MNTEAEANPAPVADDVSAADTGAETEIALDESGEIEAGDDDLPEIETVEIERNGKKYAIPKELEAELLMQSDYTKKTMSLAEERKAAQAEIEATRQAVALERDEIDTAVTVKNLAAQIEQYRNVDPNAWAQLQRDNPLEADRLEREYDRLERAFDKAQHALAAKQTERLTREQQEIAKFREEQDAQAVAKVPNFTPERRASLDKLAMDYGYTADQLRLTSANDYYLLHLAEEGLRAVQSRQKATRLTTAAAVSPAPEIKGRTVTVKATDDRASVDAWMKARQAQVLKR